MATTETFKASSKQTLKVELAAQWAEPVSLTFHSAFVET
jgi:hypothetical protein